MFNFFDKKSEGRELSNFYEGIVILDGERIYSSGESAFHGSKYMKVANLCPDTERCQELLEYAKKFEVGGEFGNMSGNEIKCRGGKGKYGKRLNSDEINAWARLGVEVQRDICKYKYNNDDKVRSVLLGTIGKVLIHPALRVNKEKVMNRLWEGRGEMIDGDVVVLGGNMLGNIWMDIRENHCG